MYLQHRRSLHLSCQRHSQSSGARQRSVQISARIRSPNVRSALHGRWRGAGVVVAPQTGCYAEEEISSTRAEQPIIGPTISGKFRPTKRNS